MDKLNPETLIVESFAPEGDSVNLYNGNDMRCTGCDSGCGIEPEFP